MKNLQISLAIVFLSDVNSSFISHTFLLCSFVDFLITFFNLFPELLWSISILSENRSCVGCLTVFNNPSCSIS